MLSSENKTVNGLWIGTELSVLELLTLRSFIHHGHHFNLWTYDELRTALPSGVKVCDASEIVPASKVFRYKNANKYGHGKGSVAGFSDLFRYKFLYEKGGWWTDMDVTCLQPLEVSEPYFFRSHHDLDVVGNVMKCEAKSELMLRCFEETERTVDESNIDWLKPIAVLNKHLQELSLQKFIRNGLSNQDKWPEVKKMIYLNSNLPEEYLFIHWMNEEWRSRKIDKVDFRHNSALGKLLIKHGLLHRSDSVVDKLTNNLRYLTRYYFS